MSEIELHNPEPEDKQYFGHAFPSNPQNGDGFWLIVDDPGYITRYEFTLTGQPDRGYPAYRWVFGDPRFGNQPLLEGVETWENRVREFVQKVTPLWENVKITKREITETPWEDVTDEFMDDDS